MKKIFTLVLFFMLICGNALAQHGDFYSNTFNPKSPGTIGGTTPGVGNFTYITIASGPTLGVATLYNNSGYGFDYWSGAEVLHAFTYDNTGLVYITQSKITDGAIGTSVSAGNLNHLRWARTFAFGDFTDTDAKKGIVICTLPAKTKIVGAYQDITTAFKGGAVNAATLRVGITAEDAAEILAAKDCWTAAARYGLADADMGSALTRAAAIQGGYLPSWTGTTAIYATLNTTNGNCNALTQGSVTIYLETERY
jgi:hypothetical protein